MLRKSKACEAGKVTALSPQYPNRDLKAMIATLRAMGQHCTGEVGVEEVPVVVGTKSCQRSTDWTFLVPQEGIHHLQSLLC